MRCRELSASPWQRRAGTKCALYKGPDLLELSYPSRRGAGEINRARRNSNVRPPGQPPARVRNFASEVQVARWMLFHGGLR